MGREYLLSGEGGSRWAKIQCDVIKAKPLNPIPLQVLALATAAVAVQAEGGHISQLIPKRVLDQAISYAIRVARVQPHYPIQGVRILLNFHY